MYPFAVGRLRCAVISDGQMAPPWEPPLASFFTPAAGVPSRELRAAIAAEGRPADTLACGYNCVLVETSAGAAVIDTGLGPRFLGYGPPVEPLVGRLGAGLAAAGVSAAELAAVVFTHLHQDHCRGAAWSGELTFPRATGFAHAAEVAFWSGPAAARDTGREHLESAREAIRLLGDRLRPFEDDAEILPGVRVVDAAGHTPGHSAVLLSGGGERLLCVGDLFYDPLQLSHPPVVHPVGSRPRPGRPGPAAATGPGGRRASACARLPHALSRPRHDRQARRRLPVAAAPLVSPKLADKPEVRGL